MAHYRESVWVEKGGRQTVTGPDGELHIYPKGYRPKLESDPITAIEFALKHEGLNLEIFATLFRVLDSSIIVDYVNTYPTGKHSRVLWFLYEFLMGKELDLDPVKRGPYHSVLDPELYYTAEPVASSRHRIYNNLLGNAEFCPIVRKTVLLKEWEEKDLAKQTSNILSAYDPTVLGRASRYLYTKETMSSFEIEKEKPSPNRLTRFVRLLQDAGKEEALSKAHLVRLQQEIVDERFASKDYRDFQNYVGELRGYYYQTLHYICPKENDVESLCNGLLKTYFKLLHSNLNPVICAAVIAFGFVFIHPFEDGNGRIHRFLIHHILTLGGFVPKGVVLPVSATMLRRLIDYDKALEGFSKPLIQVLEGKYDLSSQGQLKVHGDTAVHYRYIDYTEITEYLFSCISETIQSDFKHELDYLLAYDEVKKRIQFVVDMPDRLIDLFINLVIQNNGKLSKKKKDKHFSMLSEDEVLEMEELIADVMDKSL